MQRRMNTLLFYSLGSSLAWGLIEFVALLRARWLPARDPRQS